MKVKDIAAFRTQWRNAEGYNMKEWDEHFIGSVHGNQTYGFYRMVNGIVDHIKADLSPKLQNAQDEQAIYEFLQNAADSNATDCAVIYDSDFFMVVNNGKPFTDKDLKALLNSFQGTKSDKSKAENCEKIGRYGIGFKLAYRLMGKSDGADELLEKLAGPVLYSWKNKSDFSSFVQTEDLSSFDDSNLPLLVKIILTCFPVGFREKVKDLNYEEQVLFDTDELIQVQNFIKKHQRLLDQMNLEQGSLFFLPFGPRKHEKLKESLLNIKSGIGYAMNTLKTLEKIILQDVLVEKFPIHRFDFKIQPKTEEFIRIDPEFPFCPIHLMIGIPEDLNQQALLKKSTSLFQFFPMRNERHQMAYFIHSSSFSKITDRTRLDDQGEANIETFKYLAKAIRNELHQLKTKDFDKFCILYSALLHTDPSNEYDANLINTYLYQPILELIRAEIPTHKRNFYLKDLVVVKDTELQIDPMALGIGKEWFYSMDYNFQALNSDATNSAKLGLNKWGLKELIVEANDMLLDHWIVNLSTEEYQIFVGELKKVSFDNDFLEKFKYLKCFRFTDANGEFSALSLLDLQTKSDVFLINEKTKMIKEEIQALGFSTLEFDILDFSEIFRLLEKQLDYLTQDKILFSKITERTAQANLKSAQKQHLFHFLSQLNGIRADDLKKAAICSNSWGMVLPFFAMIAPDVEVEPWLEPFKMKESDYIEQFHHLLIHEKSADIYENIIGPFWNEIIYHENLVGEDSIVSFYQSVCNYYKLRPGMAKPADVKLIYVNEELGFVKSSDIFYVKNLEDQINYYELASLWKRSTQLNLPAPFVLEFLTQDPFRLIPNTAQRDWKQISTLISNQLQDFHFTADEKKLIFTFIEPLYPKSELVKIALFENGLGEKLPLNQLIPPQFIDIKLFEKFQISEEVYHEKLDPYFTDPADVFNQIIVEHWNYFTQHPLIHEQVVSFYEAVLHFAQLSKNPKAVHSMASVYLGEEIGFVTPNEVLYHSLMTQFESNYEQLKRAVARVSSLQLPASEILSFLHQKPFKLRESFLSRALHNHSVTLNKEELQALMIFMEMNQEHFFKLFVIDDTLSNAREFHVHRRAKKIPVYLDKNQSKWADKIREFFADSLILVPSKVVINELKNEGLLQSTALIQFLTKAKESTPELLSAMIIDSEDVAHQEFIFNKLDKIILKEGEIYDASSFQHQALQIFRNKDADYQKIRDKIFIENIEGTQFKLTDVSFDPVLTFAIERDGKYPLVLEDILPRFTNINQLICKILDQFVSYEAPTLLRKRCFESNEISAKKVMLELKKDFPILENKMQLAFVLLFSKWESRNISKDFSIYNASDSLISLDSFDHLYLESHHLIDDQAILSKSHYQGLSDLIRLEKNGKRAVFEFADQKLSLSPLIEKSIFSCSPLASYKEKNKMIHEILDCAYQFWIGEDAQEDEIQIRTGQSELDSVFDFKNYISSSTYALASEILPGFLSQWIGSSMQSQDYDDQPSGEDAVETKKPNILKNKLGFSFALGLHGPQSAIVKLRRYLHHKKGLACSQRQLNDIASKTPFLLENTIQWLFKEKTIFNSEDDRIFWLRKLYNILHNEEKNGPLPVIYDVQWKESQMQFKYKLQDIDLKQLRIFENKSFSILIEKYQLTASQILQALQANHIYLSNFQYKNIELQACVIIESLELEELENNAKEWAAAHYLKWKSEAAFQIFIYKGKMPYKIYFAEQLMKKHELGDAVYVDKKAYVNASVTNVEEALFQISNKSQISEMMLLQLLRYKNELDKDQPAIPVIEKVIEKVVVPEIIGDNQILIENPGIDLLVKTQSEKGAELTLTVNTKDFTKEELERLLTNSSKRRLIVDK